jgi:tetratricopeptide (TPR) repeat protein
MTEREKVAELIKENKHDEALVIIKQLLNTAEAENDESKHDLYYSLGLIEGGNKNFALANTYFEKALSLNPNFASTHNNIGAGLYAMGFILEARKHFEESAKLSLMSGHYNNIDFFEKLSSVFVNLASTYVSHGNPHECVILTQKALEFYSTYCKLAKDVKEEDKPSTEPLALFNVALASLEMGDYEQGFKLYDYGFDARLNKMRLRHFPKFPLWDGKPCETLLFYACQGLGDEIMFASILPDIQKVVKNIIVECDDRLINLFRASFPEITFYKYEKGVDEPLWENDHKIDAAINGVLAFKYFRKKKEDFTGTPYLWNAEQNDIAINKIKEIPYCNELKKLKIGISWKGGVTETGKKYRSIELKKFMEEIGGASPDISFISLQYTKDAKEEVDKFNEGQEFDFIQISHWPEIIDSYDHTASLLKELDLVISVPQSVVHLAGAMGVDTIQLCPKYSMWQCGAYGENPPFYGSVKNIWQEEAGNWDVVFEEARHIISEKVRKCAEDK